MKRSKSAVITVILTVIAVIGCAVAIVKCLAGDDEE